MVWLRRVSPGFRIAALITGLTALVCPVQAQVAGDKATITIAPIILAEPMVETPIPIAVGPANALPRNSFLRIKGVPPQTVFSDGHFVSAGTWALPISGLTDLKLTVPLAGSGRAELQLNLMAIDGTVLAEAKSMIAVTAGTIGSSENSASAKPAARLPGSASLGATREPQPQRIEPQTSPTMKPEEQERALKMLNRGDAEMAGGDIAAARLLYQRAADAGLAEAAMALGRSYDPAELAARGVKGLQGDAQVARKWYERARSLGAVGAEERLRRIGAP
jgi:hypothetical protein